MAKATDADFESALGGSPRTIVKFYADWCGSCQLISPHFSRLSEEERFRGIQFIEINSEENPKARRKAGVSYLPFVASFKAGLLEDTTILSWSKDRGKAAVEQMESLLANLK